MFTCVSSSIIKWNNKPKTLVNGYDTFKQSSTISFVILEISVIMKLEGYTSASPDGPLYPARIQNRSARQKGDSPDLPSVLS